jgi:hypothetical protein
LTASCDDRQSKWITRELWRRWRRGSFRILVVASILCGLGNAICGRLAADEPFPAAEPWLEFRMSSFLPPDSPQVAKRVYRLRFSPDHANLAIRDGDNNVWQFDLQQQTVGLAARESTDQRRIQDFAYSADGQHLYGIGERGTPTWLCWAAKDLTLIGTSKSVEGRHIERVMTGELMINGRDVLSLQAPSADPKIRKRSGLVRSNEGSVTLLMYNLSGMGGESGLEWKDRVEDAASSIQTPALSPHWQQVLQKQVARAVGRQSSVGGSLLLSPCGNRVVLLDRRELLLWNAATDDSWRLLGPDSPGPSRVPLAADILSAKFSPNGQLLAIGTVGRGTPDPIAGEVHLIDTVTGSWVGRITTTTQSASALDFSDDQRWLAVGSTSLVDDRVRIFDLDAWIVAHAGASDQVSPAISRLEELANTDYRAVMFQVCQLRKEPERYRDSLVKTLTYDANRAQELMGQVIARLDSPLHQVRANAESELQRMSEFFPTTIRELMDLPTLSSEARFRVKRTVAGMTGVARMSEQEWQILCRSLHALEGVNEPWAEQLLVESSQHPIRFVARQARLSHQVWRSRQRAL